MKRSLIQSVMALGFISGIIPSTAIGQETPQLAESYSEVTTEVSPPPPVVSNPECPFYSITSAPDSSIITGFKNLEAQWFYFNGTIYNKSNVPADLLAEVRAEYEDQLDTLFPVENFTDMEYDAAQNRDQTIDEFLHAKAFERIYDPKKKYIKTIDFVKFSDEHSLGCLMQMRDEIYEECDAYGKLNANNNAALGCVESKFAERLGSTYFDAACQAVSPKKSQLDEACAAVAVYLASPISLLWDDNVNVEAGATVTSFPLNPNFQGRSYIWKASASAPLLVLDPNKTGEITSAAQLFGEWTFGGKVEGFNPISLDQNRSRGEKWANGYEPLALMDINQDGEVSGAELDPISLWFDQNRDGVSQAGEVKSLEEVGVTALYYKSDRSDAKTKSIYASKGYKRVVNGKVSYGASVDWYGDGGNNGLDLVTRSAAQRSCKAKVDSSLES